MRLQQLGAALVADFRDVIVRLEFGGFKHQLPRQRITVGVQACGGQRNQRIARFDVFSGENFLAIHRADNESREVIFTWRIKAGHLRGFSADQRASGLTTRAAHAVDKLLDHVGVELAHGQIIQEKKRLRSLHQNVVDAMVDQISANRGMHSRGHGHFELGAHSVRAGNEHRLFPFFAIQGEKRAKSADAAQDSWRECPASMVADSLLRGIRQRNVHTGIGVFHEGPSVRVWRGRTKVPVVLFLENALYRRGGSAARYFVLLGTISLKSPEQSLPAHQAGMDQRIRVSKKALANLAGFPGVGRNVERHIYHHRRADYVFAGHATPKAAVVGIAAIVAHHKITIVRNFDRRVQVVRIGAAGGVAFREPYTVHPNRAVVDVDGISRQADDSLDIVRRIWRERWLEDYDLLAMGIPPQWHMPICERHAGIVADAAHDQVIADKESVFHRAGGNHPRLADGAIDEQKNQRYPKPRDDFTLHALPDRHLGLRFLAALG